MTPGDGDEAFDALVSSEREGLFRYFFWTLRDRDEALDAVQETLLRAYRGLPGLRDPGSARNWLYVIASNVAKRFRSRRSRTPRTLGGAAPDDAEVALQGPGEPSPDANLESEETRARLSDALAELEPELREPLLLFAVSGLKYREIAEVLGWPIGTVTTRIHVARERLAAKLRR